MRTVLFLLYDLIRAMFKEIAKLQDIAKSEGMNHKPKQKNIYNFGKYPLPIAF